LSKSPGNIPIIGQLISTEFLFLHQKRRQRKMIVENANSMHVEEDNIVHNILSYPAKT